VTFATDLALTSARNLRLVVEVDGIGTAFHDWPDMETATAGMPTWLALRERRPLLQSVEQGESSIDLDRRRMLGGSLRIVLLDDGTLGDLFASRSRAATFVTSTSAAASTTITVNSVTGLAAAGVVYIGGETVGYSSIVGTTLTGCTRGLHGSTAQTHYGDVTRGAPVFLVPPRWIGRRVALHGLLVDDHPRVTWIYNPAETTLDTFRIEEAPVYIGNDRWEIRCSHLSDEVAARKLGVNLRQADAVPSQPTFDAVNTRLEWRARGVLSLFPTSTTGYYPTEVAVTYDDDSGELLRFKGSDRTTFPSGSLVYTATSGLLSPGSPLDAAAGARAGRLYPRKIEHWCILQGGNAGNLALFALTSILGDAANGAYDVLPGANRDSTTLAGEEMRFGAGIPAAEVDASSFVSVGANVLQGWAYVIDEAIGVDEFLLDWCLATQSFWYVDRLGLLKAQSLSEQRTSSVRTLTTSDVIGEPTVEVLEDAIYPRATIKLGYAPWSGEFLDQLTIVDEEMAARYPERQDVLQLQSRGLSLSAVGIERPKSSQTDIEMLVRRAMLEDGRGRLYVDLVAPMTCVLLELGQVVTIGFSGLPDYQGGDLSGRRARIVARRPDYDRGTVKLRLQVVETLYHFAAAAVVSSVVGNTLNLRTTGPEVSSASPGNQFAAGWEIELCYAVALGAPTTATIASVAATSVTLTAPLAVPNPGFDYIRVRPVLSSTASVNGYLPEDFAWQQESTTTPTTRFR
jgi:hypothetical protein